MLHRECLVFIHVNDMHVKVHVHMYVRITPVHPVCVRYMYTYMCVPQRQVLLCGRIQLCLHVKSQSNSLQLAIVMLTGKSEGHVLSQLTSGTCPQTYPDVFCLNVSPDLPALTCPQTYPHALCLTCPWCIIISCHPNTDMSQLFPDITVREVVPHVRHVGRVYEVLCS